MAIRVVRFLEYNYESVKAMNEDMRTWSVAPMGEAKFNHKCEIRSVVMYPDEIVYPIRRDTPTEKDIFK